MRVETREQLKRRKKEEEENVFFCPLLFASKNPLIFCEDMNVISFFNSAGKKKLLFSSICYLKNVTTISGFKFCCPVFLLKK